MKISKFIFFVLAIFTIVSCSKDTNDEITPLAISGLKNIKASMELIVEVENLPKSSIVLGYNTLNATEKALFWNRHFDNYLKNNELSDDLRAHIIKLKTFATPELYSTLGSTKTTAFVEKFTNEWLVTPLRNGRYPAKVLTEVSTFIAMGKDETTLQKLKTQSIKTSSEKGGEGGGVTCDCIYNSYCSFVSGNSCYKNVFCNSINYDCGIAGGSRCEGSCQN